MKAILAVSLIISVVNAEPFFGSLPLWPGLNPSRRVLPQSPKPMHMHDHDFGVPVHAHSPRCQLLQNLFSFKQDAIPSCTIASICRHPETDNIIISELTESQLMTLGRPHQHKFQNEINGNSPSPCNGNFDKIEPDNVKNNNENDNNSKNIEKDVATSPMLVTNYEPMITTSPRYHGGEGLIDTRIAED